MVVTMPNQPLQADRRFAPAAERQTRYGVADTRTDHQLVGPAFCFLRQVTIDLSLFRANSVRRGRSPSSPKPDKRPVTPVSIRFCSRKSSNTVLQNNRPCFWHSHLAVGGVGDRDKMGRPRITDHNSC